jgi:hypothetical protein
MKLDITSFDTNGKYWDEKILDNSEDILEYDDKFKKLVANSVELKDNGYVMVEKLEGHLNFDQLILRTEDIIRFVDKKEG